MAIEPVTYYKVKCDEPGCTRETGSDGGEYTAWSSPDGAVDDWECGDGVIVNGKAFCEEHRPDETEEE